MKTDIRKQKALKAAGVVEAVLILVVLITLVIIFRTQLLSLVDNIFKSVNTKAAIFY